jgi:putative peptidoglycan lipid II flippase
MGLLRSLITISGNTVISRILGFLRDRLVYSVLGLSPMADAFSVSVKAPALFRRLFAEGAFNAAFVPTFSGVYADKGAYDAKIFAEKAFTLLLFILLGLVVLVELFMPQFIGLVAGGFKSKPETLQYAIEYTRITFPYILFISLTALLGAVLNSMDKFGAPAATQIIANVVVITYFVLFQDVTDTPGHAAAWGSVMSGLIQLIWLHWICTRQSGLRIGLRWPTITPEMRQMFKLFIPGLIGSGIVQLNLFMNMAIGSRLHTGGLASLHIADRVNQLPLSLIGVAMGTALLPLLYRQLKAGQLNEALDTQNRALELTLLLTFPATVTLMIYADSFIATLFMDKNFGLSDVMKTAPALVAYSTGLPAYVFLKVVSASFFAHKDTKTPMYVAGVCFFLNAILSGVSILMFNHLEMGHIGIAASLSLSSWVNVVALGWIAYRRKMLKLDKRFYRTTTLGCVACIIMGVIIYIAEPFFQSYMLYSPVYIKIVMLLALIVIGIVAFFIPAYFFGILKLKEVNVRSLGRDSK